MFRRSFFQNIDRLVALDYLPSDEDIFKVKIGTIMVSETVLPVGNQIHHVFEIGGASVKREKWIHIVDDVDLVVIVASINKFDETMIEEPSMVSVRSMFR
jgi:hypothetical protein